VTSAESTEGPSVRTVNVPRWGDVEVRHISRRRAEQLKAELDKVDMDAEVRKVPRGTGGLSRRQVRERVKRICLSGIVLRFAVITPKVRERLFLDSEPDEVGEIHPGDLAAAHELTGLIFSDGSR
jgi:hypothetical protein